MCHTNLLKYTCKHTLVIRRSTCRGTFTRVRHSRRSLPPEEPTLVTSEAVHAFCQSSPTLVLYQMQECGDCQRKAANAELEKDNELVRSIYASLSTSSENSKACGDLGAWQTDGSSDPAPVVTTAPASPTTGESLEEMEDRISRTSWLITRQYPPIPQTVSSKLRVARPKPTTGPLGPTPLRHAIDPETLPDYPSPVVIGADRNGWGGSWDWSGSGYKTSEDELKEAEDAKPKEIKEYETDTARCYKAWNEGRDGKVVASPDKSWGSRDWDCLKEDDGSEANASAADSAEEVGCAWQDVRSVGEQVKNATAADAVGGGTVRPASTPPPHSGLCQNKPNNDAGLANWRPLVAV